MNIASLVLSLAVQCSSIANNYSVNYNELKSIKEIMSISNNSIRIYQLNNKSMRISLFKNDFNDYHDFDYEMDEQNNITLKMKDNLFLSIKEDGLNCIVDKTQVLLTKELEEGNVFSYSVSSEILKYDNNYFYDNLDNMIKIGNQYLISNNNIIIPATDIIINKNGNEDYKITQIYDKNTLQLLNVEYPVTVVSTLDSIQNNMNVLLHDKYIIDSTNLSYDNSSLLIGKDKLQTINPIGSLINTEYIGIIGIDKLTISHPLDSDNIDFNVPMQYLNSASLRMTKNSFSYSNPNIKLSKINNQILFDNILGTTSLNTTFISSITSPGNQLSFDITNILRNNNSNQFLFMIDGIPTGNSGYANFASSDASINPLRVDLDFEISQYGVAPLLSTLTNSYGNCLGYAVQTNIDQLLSVPSTYSPQGLKSLLNSYTTTARFIDSYNSPIFPNERRIAFKFNKNGNGYHFVLQTSNGGWSGWASGGSRDSTNELSPESLFTNMNNGWSSIYYVAIS